MPKIDKMLAIIKCKALEEVEQREQKELEQIFNRMTTAQLQELVNEELSKGRIREIFASVDGLHLLESGGFYATAKNFEVVHPRGNPKGNLPDC